MDNRTILQVGVGIALVVILLVFVSSASKAIKKLFGFGEDETPDYVDTPIIPGEPAPIGFDATPMVVRLKEVHKAWLPHAASRCEAYEELMDLSNNEFILVCNEYYKNGGETLRSDMESTFHSGCGIFSTDWYERVIARMDALNIIG